PTNKTKPASTPDSSPANSTIDIIKPPDQQTRKDNIQNPKFNPNSMKIASPMSMEDLNKYSEKLFGSPPPEPMKPINPPMLKSDQSLYSRNAEVAGTISGHLKSGEVLAKSFNQPKIGRSLGYIGNLSSVASIASNYAAYRQTENQATQDSLMSKINTDIGLLTISALSFEASVLIVVGTDIINNPKTQRQIQAYKVQKEIERGIMQIPVNKSSIIKQGRR
nr:hypothetical protein [Bacteroidota bacterium]